MMQTRADLLVQFKDVEGFLVTPVNIVVTWPSNDGRLRAGLKSAIRADDPLFAETVSLATIVDLAPRINSEFV